MNPRKRRKLSGVRASLGDICFFFSQISIDLFNIDAHWIAFWLNFFFGTRQINAWTRSVINGKLQHLLKSMGWKVARKRKIQ